MFSPLVAFILFSWRAPTAAPMTTSSSLAVTTSSAVPTTCPPPQVTSRAVPQTARTATDNNKTQTTPNAPVTLTCITPAEHTTSATATAASTTSTAPPSTKTTLDRPSQHKPLKLSVKSQGKTYLTIAWDRVYGASEYIVRYKAYYEKRYTDTTVAGNIVTLDHLEAGTTYEVRVSAGNSSATAREGVVRVSTKIGMYRIAPFIIEVTNLTRLSAKISWYTIVDTKTYHVAYKKKTSANFTVGYVTTPTIYIDGLVEGTEYVCKVQVGSSPYGHGPWSNEVGFKTKPAPPSAPRELHVCAENVTQQKAVDVSVCWHQPIEIDVHYNDVIFYAVNWCVQNPQQLHIYGCYVKYNIKHSFRYPMNQTYVVRQLPFFSSVWVRVIAFASDGMKGGNISREFVVKSLPPPPSLQVPVVEVKSAKLSWTPAPHARGYHIVYKKADSSTLGDMFVETSTYSLRGLEGWTRYVVKVQADYATRGRGRWSKEVKFRTKQAPPSAPRKPHVLREYAGGRNTVDVLLSWAAPLEMRQDGGERDGAYRVHYSVNWCARATHKLHIYGCYIRYKVPHSYIHPNNQTYFLRNVPSGSSLWITVTSYTGAGTKGKGTSLRYLVKRKYVVEMTTVAPRISTTARAFTKFTNVSKVEDMVKELPTVTNPLSAPQRLHVCKEHPFIDTNKVDLLLCWSHPKEMDAHYKGAILYSVNWCIRATERIHIYGCYVKYKIKHTHAQRGNQTLLLRNIPHRSSVRISVSVYSTGGTKRESSWLTYLVKTKSLVSDLYPIDSVGRKPTANIHRNLATAPTLGVTIAKDINTTDTRSNSSSRHTIGRFQAVVLIMVMNGVKYLVYIMCG